GLSDSSMFAKSALFRIPQAWHPGFAPPGRGCPYVRFLPSNMAESWKDSSLTSGTPMRHANRVFAIAVRAPFQQGSEHFSDTRADGVGPFHARRPCSWSTAYPTLLKKSASHAPERMSPRWLKLLRS